MSTNTNNAGTKIDTWDALDPVRMTYVKFALARHTIAEKLFQQVSDSD
jgi:hypothetical protein